MSERIVAFVCSLAALFFVSAGHAEIPAAPVTFQGETLFDIRAPFGAFTPAERAAAIAERLEVLAGQMAALLLRGTATLAPALAVLALYFHISLVFSFFPSPAPGQRC